MEDRCDRICHVLVERQTPFVQQRVVGDLPREGVLEGVLRLRIERLLVDELRTPELLEREALAEEVVADAGLCGHGSVT